ncbi:hypothetical protein ABH962_002851 [Bacillus sp. RC54]
MEYANYEIGNLYRNKVLVAMLKAQGIRKRNVRGAL